MRIATINLYQFDELEPNVKLTALDNLNNMFKKNEYDYDFWTEAMEAVEALSKDLDASIRHYYDAGCSIRFEWLGKPGKEQEMYSEVYDIKGHRAIKWVLNHLNTKDYFYSELYENIDESVNAFLKAASKDDTEPLNTFFNILLARIECFFETQMAYEASEEYWQEHADDYDVEFTSNGDIWEFKESEKSEKDEN